MNIEEIAQQIVGLVLGADATVSGGERVQRVIDLLISLGIQNGRHSSS